MSTISIRSRPSGFASGSSSPSVIERFKRVVAYRRILKLLVARDLKVRYAGSALGYVWTVLDPLLMSLVYWFVLSTIFKRDAGPDFDPYILYLVSGQLAWAWFNGGVSGVAKALRSEAQMVRSSNVPRELWVLRVVFSKGMEYLFGLPVLAIFALAYTTLPSKDIIFFPLGIVLEFLLIAGIGLILAPATVLFRDLERIVPIFLRVMFYGSPVLYSITAVPTSIREVFSYNPAVGFLTLAHATFFPAALHEPRRVPTRGADHKILHQIVNGKRVEVTHIAHYTDHWNWVWHSALASVLIIIVGAFLFVRLERSVLKEI